MPADIAHLEEDDELDLELESPPALIMGATTAVGLGAVFRWDLGRGADIGGTSETGERRNGHNRTLIKFSYFQYENIALNSNLA